MRFLDKLFKGGGQPKPVVTVTFYVVIGYVDEGYLGAG